MSSKSKYVVALDQIQAKVNAFLKPRGFKKKGRTFNREASEPGIFQVIHFQSGHFPIGDYVIPGFRENLYGKFTVNMGVLLKELYELETYHKPTNFYQEMHCRARTRLPVLLQGKDFCWDLDQDLDAIADEIVDGLNSVGFEYFMLYDTRAKFCENFGKYRDATPRAKLDVALVVLHQDRQKGERLVQEYYSQITQKGHKDYVERLCAPLNIPLPTK
jgi:hypothetical protein